MNHRTALSCLRHRAPDGTAALTSGVFGLPLLKEPTNILVRLAGGLSDLDDNPFVELQLITILDWLRLSPMVIANPVPRLIVDHNPLVEAMIFGESILPSFRLSAQVECVEASKV